MEQTKEDLENIKSKLVEHIKTNYPENKANEFISNINSMDDSQFIDFLKQQGLIKNENSSSVNQCVFCSIIFGDIPSTKIGENEKSIAILDLNPASLGHTLLIPKEHIEKETKLPEEIKQLANQISKDLKKAFNPQRIDQIPTNVIGHQIINLLPVYNQESIESPRRKQTPEQLEEIKKKIESTKPEQIESEKSPEETIPQEEINQKNTWLPKRIP